MKNQICLISRDGDTDIIRITLRRKIGPSLYAIIDESDLRRAHEFPGTWHAAKDVTCDVIYVKGWIRKSNGKPSSVNLHNWLFRSNRQLDHKDRNGLNNRRINLRFASNQLNAMNRGPFKNSKTGIRGVWWSSRAKKWIARIRINGKPHQKQFTNIKQAKKFIQPIQREYGAYFKHER